MICSWQGRYWFIAADVANMIVKIWINLLAHQSTALFVDFKFLNIFVDV